MVVNHKEMNGKSESAYIFKQNTGVEFFIFLKIFL